MIHSTSLFPTAPLQCVNQGWSAGFTLQRHRIGLLFHRISFLSTHTEWYSKRRTPIKAFHISIYSFESNFLCSFRQIGSGWADRVQTSGRKIKSSTIVSLGKYFHVDGLEKCCNRKKNKHISDLGMLQEFTDIPSRPSCFLIE